MSLKENLVRWARLEPELLSHRMGEEPTDDEWTGVGIEDEITRGDLNTILGALLVALMNRGWLWGVQQTDHMEYEGWVSMGTVEKRRTT